MGNKMSLNEIHQVQIEMLKCIDEFCKKQNIRYSLGGGTLLGAVRHHGFIPWDDDVDIMMPRQDYELFMRSFCDYYPHYKKFTDKYPDNPILFDKVYDDRTLLLEEGLEYGVFIDIFAIDGFPKQKELIFDFFKKERLYLRLIKIKNKSIKKIPFKSLFSSLLPPMKILKNKMSCLYSTYDFEKSPLASVLMGEYGIAEVMKDVVYKEYTRLDFEGVSLSCIKHYDTYLTQHYGHYMELPPEDKRKTTHNIEVYWK